jgi:hypothetical protein
MLLREMSFAAVRSGPPVNDWHCGFGISGVRRMEIRRIEIIFTGYSNQCEKRISPQLSSYEKSAGGLPLERHLFSQYAFLMG